MLTDIEDEAGTGKREAVAAAWDRVTREMAALGYHLANPAAAHIVRMPITGASRFEGGTHLLFVSERAARSEMLAGLVAHEFSHMLLTERGHPSHDFDLLLAVAREVARDHGLRDGVGLLVDVEKHAQDIYADDITLRVLGADPAVEFFEGWVAGNLRALSGDRHANLLLWATNCFALANLERHGLADRAMDAYRDAAAFDLNAGFLSSDRLVTTYRNLPHSADRPLVSSALRHVCELAAGEAAPR